MFTGIILGLGEVVDIQDSDNFRRFAIDHKGLLKNISHGVSIAINGVCLTVTKYTNTIVHFDVIGETLEKTTLGSLQKGDKVNLESSLHLGDEINGHLVQGHVDDKGRVTKKEQEGENVRVWISLPKDHITYLVAKGSIAIDGISMTIVDVDKKEGIFSVAVIPTTLELTTLGIRNVGDLVNIEIDYQAKLIHTVVEQYFSSLEKRIQLLEEARNTQGEKH